MKVAWMDEMKADLSVDTRVGRWVVEMAWRLADLSAACLVVYSVERYVVLMVGWMVEWKADLMVG